MQEFNELFAQFYLHRIKNLNLTKTSSYAKVDAYTQGVMKRYKNKLYQSQKYFITDLQTIMDFDAESAMVVFKEYSDSIRFQELKESQLFDLDEGENLNTSRASNSLMQSTRRIKREGNPYKKQVLVQCNRCGKFTKVFKYCAECQDTHYCSETCEMNLKITHIKEQCIKTLYPRLLSSVIVQIHFGSDLGQNIEIYFQHQSKMSALVRGKRIVADLFNYFKGEKQYSIKSAEYEERSPNKYGQRFDQKLRGYNIILHSQQTKDSLPLASNSSNVKVHFLEFRSKNQKQHKTVIEKTNGKQVELEIDSMDKLENIYTLNPLLEEIQLYLLRQGGLMFEKIEEIHNNHIHYVYVFRIF